jgi:hypothetical protein
MSPYRRRSPGHSTGGTPELKTAGEQCGDVRSYVEPSTGHAYTISGEGAGLLRRRSRTASRWRPDSVTDSGCWRPDS